MIHLPILTTMKTPIITRHGYNRLMNELNHLWRVERRETTEKVTWAAALGDRSENADYKELKAKLRRLDKRIRYLQKRTEALRVVDYNPQQEGKVFFGAEVEIENEQEEILTVRIVGYDEIFFEDQEGYISVDSPMAKALLGKEVDDDIRVDTPTGIQEWLINRIVYPRS